MKLKWEIKRFVDPIHERPFLNPQNKTYPEQITQQDLWLPYSSDKDETPF